ncbi:hypothetical protein SIO57_005736 [Klebsiella pneumoniae]|nr:hypothetical protein [Klebsiella pneumoniae]
MTKKIIYVPFNTGVNQYGQRIKEILSSYGEVKHFCYEKELFFLFKRNDIAIVNWLENQLVNSAGRFTYFGFIKVILKILFLKMKCKKVFYVRHNIYPHNTNIESVRHVIRMTNLLTRFFNETIVHSPKHPFFNVKYIPHPLYKYPLCSTDCVDEQKNKDLYVIFGRIVRYKKIDEVIRLFPNNKSLVIAGACEDDFYLDELKVLAERKDNITILSGFLDNEKARELVISANAMIISHSDEDMIVSGSFFYALSQGVSILCIDTPFMKWAEDTLSKDIVLTFKTIPDMCSVIGMERMPYTYTNEKIELINNLFGDKHIHEAIGKLFD